MDRERARLFDREAERYDRSRPTYPDAVIDEVLGPEPAGVTVLDVACGTGIASRQMTARGARVLGVELNPGMARIARRHGIATEVAAFETWEPAGRTFDVVTCAQAWHWLDPEVSLEKAALVLRAGGRLCVIWSVGHHPNDLAAALEAVYRRALPPGAGNLTVGYSANTMDHAPPDFRAAFAGLRARDKFETPQVKSVPWARVYTRDEWLDELQSHSDHAALAADLRSSLLNEVARTIDDFGGSFRMAYETILISAARK